MQKFVDNAIESISVRLDNIEALRELVRRDRVVGVYTGADGPNFVRFFRVPGMGHSRGGEGVNRAALDSINPPPDAVDGYPGLYRDVLTYLKERIKEVLTGASGSVVVRTVMEHKDGMGYNALTGAKVRLTRTPERHTVRTLRGGRRC